jgi:hypothetical protein
MITTSFYTVHPQQPMHCVANDFLAASHINQRAENRLWKTQWRLIQYGRTTSSQMFKINSQGS